MYVVASFFEERRYLSFFKNTHTFIRNVSAIEMLIFRKILRSHQMDDPI